MAEYVGLDVSMKETAVSIRRDGKRVWRGKCASDPKLIAEVIRRRAPGVARTFSALTNRSRGGCNRASAPCDRSRMAETRSGAVRSTRARRRRRRRASTNCKKRLRCCRSKISGIAADDPNCSDRFRAGHGRDDLGCEC